MNCLRTHLFLVLWVGLSLSLPVWSQGTELLLSPQQLKERLSESTVLWIGMAAQAPDTNGIPGSVYLSWEELTTTRDGVPNELPTPEELEEVFRRAGVTRDGPIVVYDEGSGLAAARAFMTLDYLGQGARTALLDGGLAAWVESGYPVEKSSVPPPPGDFVGELQAFRLIDGDELNSPNGQFALFDARPKEEYRGREPGEGVGRPGHIPGATSVFWQRHLKDGRFKSIEKLSEMYAEAGEAHEVVTYCRTGGQASHAYFVLRYLGYQPRLYDGSYFEWSRGFGPVERDDMLFWRSRFSPEQTIERLKAALARQGLTVMADIDHQAGARKTGLELGFTRLFIFGNPAAGTPLMQKSGSAALDLPLKIAVWEDDEGVHLAYREPRALDRPHRLESPPQLAKMGQVLRRLAIEAAGASDPDGR